MAWMLGSWTVGAAVLYLQGHGATEISTLRHEPYERVEHLVCC